MHTQLQMFSYMLVCFSSFLFASYRAAVLFIQGEPFASMMRKAGCKMVHQQASTIQIQQTEELADPFQVQATHQVGKGIGTETDDKDQSSDIIRRGNRISKTTVSKRKPRTVIHHDSKEKGNKFHVPESPYIPPPALIVEKVNLKMMYKQCVCIRRADARYIVTVATSGDLYMCCNDWLCFHLFQDC